MAPGAVCYAHLPAEFHTGYFDFALAFCFSNSFMPRLTNNSLSALAATDFAVPAAAAVDLSSPLMPEAVSNAGASSSSLLSSLVSSSSSNASSAVSSVSPVVSSSLGTGSVLSTVVRPVSSLLSSPPLVSASFASHTLLSTPYRP